MSINIVPEPGSDDHARAIAQASVPLLVASGLHATWVERDLVAVTDGRGVCLLVRVPRLRGVAEAVWRLFVRYGPVP